MAGLSILMNLVGFNLVVSQVTSAQRGGLNRSIEKVMKTLVEKIRGRAVFYTRGSRAGNPPDRLGRVSGKLAASIASRVKGQSGTIVGEIFTQRLVYARIHEFGGTIFPRRAPFLVFETKEGNLVFAKKVTIPARPYIGRALDDFAEVIKDDLGDAFKASLE
jgi:phage gpG-like protein